MHLSKDNIIVTDEQPLDPSYLGGVGHVCFKALRESGDRVCSILSTTGETDTCSDLLTRSIRTALLLRKFGIERGDVITCDFDVQINSSVPVLAAYYIGAIPSYIDIVTPLDEVAHLLKITAPKLVVTYNDPDQIRHLEQALKMADLDVRILVLDSAEGYLYPQEGEEEFEPIYVEDLNDTAAIMYSSGTTGLPKGICLNHYSLLCMDILDWVPLSDKPIITFAFDSLYWIIETWRMIASFRKNSIRLIVPLKDDEVFAIETWRDIEKYKVNVAYIGPTEIAYMCKTPLPKGCDVSNLIAIYSLGFRLPLKYITLFQEIVPHVKILQMYGMTECGICTTFSMQNKRHMDLMKQKITSIGLPLEGSGMLYRIVDIETGENLGPYKHGELRVKRNTVMKGHYNKDSSNEFDEFGYMKTGDKVYYDEDFCFYYVDRLKEMMVFQGWHLLPAYLEEHLLSHPAVKRAAVIGKRDEVDGDHPMAIVTLDQNVPITDPEDIRNYVNEKVADKYQLRGGIVVLDEIPVTSTGKINRRLIKEMFSS